MHRFRTRDSEEGNWLQDNTFHHENFTLDELRSAVAKKCLNVIVIVPAKDVALTIRDGTGSVAAACGADVLQHANIAPELGNSKGKGDAMWRALLSTSPGSSKDEVVAFMDGDTGDPTTAHLIGIIGPLIMHDHIQMTRGLFARPFQGANRDIRPDDGGRVTELMARPLLNLHFPKLSVFSQPLAGEFAARRGLLEQLALPVGYGIEIATLIDAWRLVGLQALAQGDLGTRQNDHKPLRSLITMSFAVMTAVERRLERSHLSGKNTSTSGSNREIPNQIYLPWESQHCEVHAEERIPIADYKLSMTSPFINIEGVRNFRDIGGLPTTTGYCTRRGLVFRSADFSKCTETGFKRLDSLGIKSVFDLRSTREIESAQKIDEAHGESYLKTWTKQPNGPKYNLVPIFNDSDYSPEALAERFKDYATKGTEGFERAYEAILDNSRNALTEIFNHLSRPNPEPIVVHCTAGKDRTGVVIMVLLLLAGCKIDAIAREYSLTNVGLGETWRSETIDRLSKHPTFQGEDRAGIERMVSAREDVMLAVIQNLEKDFGGVQGFLATIDLEDGQIQRVKKVLQEPESHF